MKCPSCGAESQGKFCEYCGSEMPQEKPQVGGCPKCGSSNVSFKRERVGTSTQRSSRKNIIGTGRTGQSVSQSAYRTVGLCQNCGYTWNPNAASNSSGKKTWLWVLGWICIFPIPLTILMLRKKDMKPAVKYGIIAAAWLLFLIIGLAGNGETETSPSDIPPSTEAVIAQKTTETPTESTEPPTETREVSDETTVQFVESEAIKNLLFSISSWDTITEDSVKSSAESNGLEVDVDMGWGGTSWQYYFSDAQSKHCSLMLFFVHPQKENFAEHLKYFTLTFDGAGDVYLHYYSSWNRDNDDDGKYGFYVGDVQFEDLESAYEYYLSLVVG